MKLLTSHNELILTEQTRNTMLLSRAVVIALLVQTCTVLSFQQPSTTTKFLSTRHSWWCDGNNGRIVVLAANKKKGRGGSKGFGKVEETKEVPSNPSKPATMVDAPKQQSSAAAAEEPSLPKGAFLQSVEGGTTSTPAMEELPPEERAKQILREKYGMKTLEEQQANDKQMKQLKAQQKKLAELKKKAELDEDIDIIAMVPPSVLKALDTFLKAGVAISGTAFILAGFGITAEAWSKASGNALPEDIDNFIVNVLEPNFTPGLLVVLGFSISLGLLAAASLGSEGAQYREK